MDSNIGQTPIKEEDISYYLDHCINRIFAILGIYEDCQEFNNYDGFHAYLNRMIIEFNGLYDIFKKDIFVSLIGILRGMNIDELTHKEIKSLVFHCISLIKRGVNKDAIL